MEDILNLINSDRPATKKRFKPTEENNEKKSEDKLNRSATVVKQKPVDLPCKPPQENVQYFTAVYAKQSSKKHKIWTDDGYIEIKGKTATLRDSNGKIQGTTKLKTMDEVECGTRFSMGSNEAEIIDLMTNIPQYQSTSVQLFDETDEFQHTVKKKPKTNFCFSQNLHLGRNSTVICSDVENKEPDNNTENTSKSKKAATPACFKPALCLGRTPSMRQTPSAPKQSQPNFSNVNHIL